MSTLNIETNYRDTQIHSLQVMHNAQQWGILPSIMMI